MKNIKDILARILKIVFVIIYVVVNIIAIVPHFVWWIFTGKSLFNVIDDFWISVMPEWI